MTIRDLLEAEPIGPLTPKQAQKRSEKQRRQQQRIADERSRSAAKVRDLRADMP